MDEITHMRIDEIYAQKCAEPSDINEHLPVLKYCASKCETVTEFGVRSVVSTWALIAGRPGQVSSYDLNSPGESVLIDVKTIAREAKVFFVFYQMDTREANINPTDLLFIDTFHTYLQLKTELSMNAGMVRRWIVLHDTEIFGEKGEDGGPGLNQAVREFVDGSGEWLVYDKLANNNGLTILQRK